MGVSKDIFDPDHIFMASVCLKLWNANIFGGGLDGDVRDCFLLMWYSIEV
jgi:hypothetical protein